MLGRNDYGIRAVNGVDSSSEDADLLPGGLQTVLIDGEIDLGAGAPPNPIALHGDNPLRPAAFQSIQVVQQLIGVFGDADEPLFQLAQLDRSVFVPRAET